MALLHEWMLSAPPSLCTSQALRKSLEVKLSADWPVGGQFLLLNFCHSRRHCTMPAKPIAATATATATVTAAATATAVAAANLPGGARGPGGGVQRGAIVGTHTKHTMANNKLFLGLPTTDQACPSNHGPTTECANHGRGPPKNQARTNHGLSAVTSTTLRRGERRVFALYAGDT